MEVFLKQDRPAVIPELKTKIVTETITSVRKHERFVCSECDGGFRRLYLYGLANDLGIPVRKIPAWLCRKCVYASMQRENVAGRCEIDRGRAQLLKFSVRGVKRDN